MKKSIFTAVLMFAVLAAIQLNGAEVKWHTDFAKAQELAQKENKPMLLFFTGSDWCGWCKKLNKEILTQKEFVRWTEKNVVPVEVDFPRKPNPKLVKQNNELQQKYKVRGYPTLLLTTPAGEVFAKTGYMRNSNGKKYVAHLKDLMKKNPAK